MSEPPTLSRPTASSLLTFPAALVAAQFLVLFWHSIDKIAEPDIWWHLRMAEHLVQSGSFPLVDRYSFTAAGTPWVPHQWLSELFFYGAHAVAGLQGIFLLYVALEVAIFVGLYRLCVRSGANPKTAALVLILGITIASVSFGPRMFLFGWLAMVVLLLILERCYREDLPAPWYLPLLFCLWINLHGSWVFGLVVLGAFVASGFLQGRWGIVESRRLSAPQQRRWLLVGALCVAALFVNPFFHRLVAYPFDLLFRQQINIANIVEWRSVDFHLTTGKVVLIMLLALFASLLLSRRRFALHEALLALFAMYYSLMHWRMQFFAVLIFTPLIAARLPLFPPYEPEKEKPLLNAAVIAAVLVIVLFRFPSERELRSEVEQQYPAAALAFMQAEGKTDRVFNEYGWGGYMIWHARDIPPFIDGRADVFVYTGVFQDYIDAIRMRATLEVLDKHEIRHVLAVADVPFSYLLETSRCWQQVYRDELAVVFSRAPGYERCVPPRQ